MESLPKPRFKVGDDESEYPDAMFSETKSDLGYLKFHSNDFLNSKGLNELIRKEVANSKSNINSNVAEMMDASQDLKNTGF